MRVWCSLLLVLACYSSSQFSRAVETQIKLPNAEVVWVETKNKRHTIYYRHTIDEDWESSAVAIYSSNNPITTPFLTTKRSGEKYLFWAEQQAGAAVIKMLSGRVNLQSEPEVTWDKATLDKVTWAKPMLFSDLGRFSIAPNAVVDWADNVWLFWAADVAQYSDVYFSKTTNNGWSKPKLVHEANKVPDNTPFAAISTLGNIELSWQTFNIEASQYQVAKKEFLLESTSRENEQVALLAKERALVASVAFPDWLPKRQRLFIHFPNNKLVQAIEARTLIATKLSN